MRAILVDTGPLVALLDRSDEEHESIRTALDEIHEPLVTAWPVIVEAMYLLSFSWRAQKALWEMLETDVLGLLPLESEDFPRLKQLMEKYRDLPMDLADAALVRVAERDDIRRVLTLDQSPFGIYRLPRKGTFTVLP